MTTDLVDWPPLEEILPKVELIAEDGEPMESNWHFFSVILLIESIKHHLRGRDDYYAGGNQFIYFDVERARNRNFRGPDFYLVLDVPREPIRDYWCVWEEGGKYPNVIVELLSPTTAKADRTVKKDIYAGVFRTPFYYCYDPATQTLEGWRQPCDGYLPLTPNERGWLWCPAVELWLGTWEGKFLDYHGTWLRFYDSNGEVVPTPAEAATRQASAESQRASAESQRAEAAERENVQLKVRIAELEQRSQQPD